jgi:holin-like protein
VLNAFLILIGCQLLGELIHAATNLPIPGPVIGMFLLAAILALTGGRPGAGVLASLERTAETLIGLMGLLFVPAGVGVITEEGLFMTQWLPILAAVVGSTVLSIAVTGLVMHWTMTSASKDKTAPEPSEALWRKNPS